MTRYVAFLRGLNVGGHRVKMDRLRTVFEGIGLDDVATFIASGNVIFTTETGDIAALETRIAGALREALGYDVATFIRTLSAVATLAASEPFADDSAAAAFANRHVIFLHAPVTPAVCTAIDGLATATDAFVASAARTEVHFATAGGLTESAVDGKDVERALGRVPSSTRNVRTLRRLTAKFGS